MSADRLSNRAPLRKIVGYERNQVGSEIDVLECGHKVHRKHDIYGPTNAIRRRCRQCYAEGQRRAS